MKNKSNNAYKTIGEVVKILDLKDRNNKSNPTHTIRFWESKFVQIKPKIFNGNRRYYDEKNIDLLKKIKFLLKDQGMTIKGAKQILKTKDSNQLDEILNESITADKIKNNIKNILKIIKYLKKIK